VIRDKIVRGGVRGRIGGVKKQKQGTRPTHLTKLALFEVWGHFCFYSFQVILSEPVYDGKKVEDGGMENTSAPDE
jgi:dipeptide/tripeptide permease